MFQNIGFTELLLIAVVALVLFGPQKLPEIGRVLGRTLRDFKKAASEIMSDEPPQVKAPEVLAVAPAQQAVEQAASPAPEVPAAGLVAGSPALDAAPIAAPFAPVAFVASAPAETDASTVSTAPAAAKPAVAFVSSAPAFVEADSAPPDAQPAHPAPAATAAAPAAVQLNKPRRLPD
ncbi:twin-arginine translocase TatA/TatE family subunit [Paenibacillus aceris]|uniref:Sec-independent protein translocase protein TatA n=1 Tax=Paenibacillus aceris TaxID=869555 RepID=A0ABS4I2P8_9BACL|nr:twin-arginine translocase TatA/TatE family subunit [Paenibacillus aceris]MBP1965174.1 TatA/E family protein of Tat protein translocase [Paenibacillus aceris]NHW33155.1 twin-arginine translocase TatA/TatE family subunit [Paenibacillus aceris]